MGKKLFETQNRLGRGLDSLLGPSTSNGDSIVNLDIDRVSPNENQPRKHFPAQELEELAASIAKHGLLQPILVRPFGDNYQIIAGERRWRAVQKAGLHKIPAIVKQAHLKEQTLWALLENLQRSDLNPLEEAKAYKKLLTEEHLTQEELAASLGRSRASVANLLRLLNLDSQVQEWLAEGLLTFSQAREILKAKSSTKQRELAKQCLHGGLTVRSLSRKLNKKSPQAFPAWLESSLSELRQKYDWNIHLNYKKAKGRISFPFKSEKELKILLDRLWMKT